MGTGKIGNRIKGVGVAVGNIKMGGRIMIPPPPVAVADGTAVGTSVLVDMAVGIPVLVEVPVGTRGVGGAAIDANVSGIQTADVTEPAIHANPPLPPANSIYHHVLSKFFPATLAVPPCGIEPIIPYTCPGPLRTFATVLVVTVGVHTATTVTGLGVSDGMTVAVNVRVAVSVPTACSVAGAPPGRLQASTASAMKKSDKIMFLLFASIRYSSERLMLAL
jgi:hypothetical protein